MKLTNKNINGAIEDIRAFFENAKIPRKDVIKICLFAEESLLRYQEKFGENHEFNLYKRKWFSAPKIIIRIKGEPFSPLESEQEDDTILSNEVMQSLLHYEEAKTIYRYENGYNELISTSTKERRPLKIPGGSITIAIILAVIFSLVLGHFPKEIQDVFANGIVTPILSTLMQLIVTVTVFMIFFSIVAGICAIEDVTMLNNIGTKVVGRFFLIDVIIVIVTFLISSLFFPVMSIVDKNVVDVSQVMEIFLSIIPTNILEAFLKGKVLQVTIMAFAVGICIIKIGNRISEIKTLITELNLLIFKIVEFEAFIIAFLSIQLSFASPNAAGGIVASFTLLLTQLGLPTEYVGTLMIADVLTGNLFTGLNVLVRQCELMTVAHKMDFIRSD